MRKDKKNQKKIIKQKRFQKMQQFLNYKKYGFDSGGGEALINKDQKLNENKIQK